MFLTGTHTVIKGVHGEKGKNFGQKSCGYFVGTV